MDKVVDVVLVLDPLLICRVLFSVLFCDPSQLIMYTLIFDLLDFHCEVSILPLRSVV